MDRSLKLYIVSVNHTGKRYLNCTVYGIVNVVYNVHISA
jgi:hypothetical protein